MPDRDIIAVLISLDLEHSNLAACRLVHQDGRPFTPAETELFFNAGVEELEAAADAMQTVAAAASAKASDHERLAELLRPYGDRLTVSQALLLMSAAERAETEKIMARLGPVA